MWIGSTHLEKAWEGVNKGADEYTHHQSGRFCSFHAQEAEMPYYDVSGVALAR